MHKLSTKKGFLPIVLGVGAALALTASIVVSEQQSSDAVPPGSLNQSQIEQEYSSAVNGDVGAQLALPAGYSWPQTSELSDTPVSKSRESRRTATETPTLLYAEGVGTSQAVVYSQWAWQKFVSDAHKRGDSASVDQGLHSLESWAASPLTRQYYENPDEWAADVLAPARAGDFTMIDKAAEQAAPSIPTIESLGDL